MSLFQHKKMSLSWRKWKRSSSGFLVRVQTVQFLGRHDSSVSQRGEVNLEMTFG